PVSFYVGNFLGLSVGTGVPVGYYDNDAATWIPSENGRVIKVVSISGGLADLDTNGDATADSAAALTALGITTAEQQQLAAVYTVGQSLWRVPLTHLSRWDCNLNAGPDGGGSPDGGDPQGAEGGDGGSGSGEDGSGDAPPDGIGPQGADGANGNGNGNND